VKDYTPAGNVNQWETAGSIIFVQIFDRIASKKKLLNFEVVIVVYVM